MQNGRRFSNLPLKYDIYSEVLAAKRSASDSVLLNSAQISAFAFQDPSLNLNRNFRRLSYTVKGISDTQGSFFEVMHEGTKYALLRKYRKTIRKANYQGAYGADKLYDEFIGSSDLFLRLPDSPNLVEVKLNRKSLMAALGDRKAEAEKQVEQEKIDLKTEAGAIRLLELLEKAEYSGWYVLEQDTVVEDEPPEGEGPVTDVRKSVAYLEQQLEEPAEQRGRQ